MCGFPCYSGDFMPWCYLHTLSHWKCWFMLKNNFLCDNYSFFFFFLLLAATILGQGSNLCHSRHLSCCSDNTIPLTYCTTRKLLPLACLMGLPELFLDDLSWGGLKAVFRAYHVGLGRTFLGPKMNIMDKGQWISLWFPLLLHAFGDKSGSAVDLSLIQDFNVSAV